MTDDEYARFARVAGPQTVSGWARDVLVATASASPSLEQVVLAEVVALRTIILNLHFALASGETLTTETMHRLIERADEDKVQKAHERLAAASAPEAAMSEAWGRASAAGTWPHPKPVWTLAVLLVALTSGGAVAVYRYHVLWTPLQRIYAPTYLRCRLMAALGFTTTGRYRLLEVESLAGTRLALEEEVQPVPAGPR